MRTREMVDRAGEIRGERGKKRDRRAHSQAAQSNRQNEIDRCKQKRGEPRNAIQSARAVRERVHHFAQPFVQHERRAKTRMRKNILCGNRARVENIVSNGEMPPQIAVAVEHVGHEKERDVKHEQKQQNFERGQERAAQKI